MTNPYVEQGSEVSLDNYGPVLTKGPDGDAPGDAWFQGIPAIEDGEGLAKSISERDYIGIGIGVASVGLDVLGAVFDPIGTVASYIASWMLDHVSVLRATLDGLAGSPDVVRAYAATWLNVSEALYAAHEDLTARIDPETATWQGRAAEGYRGSAHGTAKLLGVAAAGAKTAALMTMLAGEIVAAVRKSVRDILAILAGELVNATVELLATAGLAASLVSQQVTLQIARCVERVSALLAKMVMVMDEILVCADGVKRLIDNAYKAYKRSPWADK